MNVVAKMVVLSGPSNAVPQPTHPEEPLLFALVGELSDDHEGWPRQQLERAEHDAELRPAKMALQGLAARPVRNQVEGARQLHVLVDMRPEHPGLEPDGGRPCEQRLRQFTPLRPVRLDARGEDGQGVAPPRVDVTLGVEANNRPSDSASLAGQVVMGMD